MTATTFLRQVEELTGDVVLIATGLCPDESLLRCERFEEQFCRYAKEEN